MTAPHLNYRTHLDAARTALGSSDYFTAERECVQASICLAAMPLEAGRGNAGDQMKTRAMEELKQLQESIRTLSRRDPATAPTAGFTVVPTYYASPRGVSNDW